MALSYRKIKAAHLPLSAATNLDSLSVLSNAAKQVPSEIGNVVASRRMAKIDDNSANVEPLLEEIQNFSQN